MAVAAGVVIVAITNSSSDDLEEQSPDLEGRCNGTEIYDPILAAAGVKGQVVGTFRLAEAIVEGSAVGCIPVCFWVEPSANDGESAVIGPGDIKFIRERKEGNLNGSYTGQGNTNATAVFRNPTTIAFPLSPGPSPSDIPLNHDSTLQNRGFASSLVDPAEVRVGPGQDDCFIYNSSGQIAKVR